MRRAHLALVVPCLFVLAVACNDDASNAFDTNADQGETATGTGTPADIPLETGDSANDEIGDGDGDPDPDTGDGDGDGDPTTGDGDGDPTTGDPACGNGTVDLGEQCDGADLGGVSCADLGYSGGTLGCDPVTCTYDASGCTAGGDGGGGTTG